MTNQEEPITNKHVLSLTNLISQNHQSCVLILSRQQYQIRYVSSSSFSNPTARQNHSPFQCLNSLGPTFASASRASPLSAVTPLLLFAITAKQPVSCSFNTSSLSPINYSNSDSETGTLWLFALLIGTPIPLLSVFKKSTYEV